MYTKDREYISHCNIIIHIIITTPIILLLYYCSMYIYYLQLNKHFDTCSAYLFKSKGNSILPEQYIL